MKEKQQDDLLQQTMRRSESLKMKGSQFNKLLREKKENKLKEVEAHKLKIQRELENIKMKNIRRAQSIEANRQKTGHEVEDRLNKFRFIRNKNIKEIKDKFVSKANSSLTQYKVHMGILSDKEIEKEENLKEAAFMKFSKFVINLLILFSGITH